jgi:SNF2 family DNA or RNA helicase
MSLWPHQALALDFVDQRHAAMLHIEMGGGKSRIVCDAISRWDLPYVLIVCPRAVVGVWRGELAKWSTSDRAVVCLDRGNTRDRAKVLEALPARVIVVVNYDSLRRPELLAAALRTRWHAVIADESHRLKNSGSQTALAVYKVAQNAKRRLALTGTPAPASPLDLFAQFRFLDSRVFGDSWETFAQKYGVAERINGTRQIVYRRAKRDALPELRERYKTLAFRAGKECLRRLPGASHQVVYVELAPAAREIYDNMEKGLRARVAGRDWTAANAAVGLLRLTQISGGFVRDGKDAKQIDFAKQQALEDLLSDTDEAAVVFARFKDDLKVVRTVAESLGRPYGEVSGRRKDLTAAGEMPKTRGLILGVQIASGGTGVNLTAARLGIYYSVDFVLGNFEQSFARLHRHGQEFPVFYRHLIARNTADEIVYSCLRNKRDAVAEFLKERVGS